MSDVARNIGGGLEVDVFIKGRHRKIQHRVQVELRLYLRLVILGGGKRILGWVRQQGGDIITPWIKYKLIFLKLL